MRVKIQFAPMVRFSVRVKHDHGTSTLRVMSPNRRAAIAQAMQAEGCPRRAIIATKKLQST